MVNYRLISNGGYVDYQMAVKKDAKNYLAVTYHASDAGKRMNIYAGSTKIAEVTASGRNETVRYEIPAEAVVAAEPASADTIKGRDALHIVFRADAGTDAPKLCGKVQILTDYSENANLASLSFDKGALSPDFDAETEEYTLTVPSGEKKVKLTSVPADKYGLVYVNDLLINDAAPKEITIAGAPLVIKVYAEDHQTFKTYIINFNNQ